MNYDMEKCELTLEMNGATVKLTFESETPETSIWHYVFSSLANKTLPPVQQPDAPIE